MLPVKLILLRTIFGKFSYPFQSGYHTSSKLIRSKKYYLRACSKVDPLNHFIKALDSQPTDHCFKTDKQITFGDLPFDLTFRKVLAKKRQYRWYDVEKYKTHLWRRLGYRERIFNTSVQRVFHFLDNVFFFGELFFADLRNVDDQKIASVLIKKYTGKANTKLNGDFLINGVGGYIFVENTGINLSIKYINTANTNINNTIDEITNTVTNNEQITQNELMDNL